MGVGSVGIETDRIDEYSDLDFFVIVSPGYTQRFIDQLDWLEDVHPLAYHFKNSDAGHKILFEDGIYGEFAVFDEKELETAGYAGARIVWRDPAFVRDIPQSNGSFPRLKAKSVDYAIGEAVTNLYVGLGRYHRGEKFTASLFVHSYALCDGREAAAEVQAHATESKQIGRRGRTSCLPSSSRISAT
jgi:lincosamide nucleotidyltransferase